MNLSNIPAAQRILVIDDNRAIHEDFRKILSVEAVDSAALDQRETVLFGEPAPQSKRQVFQIDSAYHGQEGLRLLEQSLESNQPYALAFVDVRMGPHWDGIQTTAKLWEAYPDLQVVICTAYSDYSWEETVAKLGYSDRLVILKKPFDNVEVQQLANALTQKWRLLQHAKVRMEDLERSVSARTEQLQTANAQLEAEIAERKEIEAALQSAYDKLRQSQQGMMQQERLAAVGQLSAGIAHDFNNILCIIQGYVSLLLDAENRGQDKVDALKQVATAAQRAAHLTRQLLAFSRKQVMQPQMLEFNEVIGNVSRMLQRLVGEDIIVQFHFSPKPVYIHADLGMMEQIIVNLAVNARDAMIRGGQLILNASAVDIDEAHLQNNPEARPGPFVCLSVTDTGSGISAENLSRIFEPFFTTKPVGKGTGLGLSTVYGIVKQHQGWIEVASEFGRGTTFHVFLPRGSKPSSVQGDTTFQSRSHCGQEKVLLVEDEAALRGLARQVLTKQGYQIFEAASGAEALEVWEQHAGAFDLLLTDMVMPGGMTGRDLAEKLLADKPALKVVFTSGYSTDMMGNNFVLEEEVNFLPKPYPPKALIQIVRACLDGDRPNADLAHA
ncbi:MAG: response regulator [Verrucomicrobia bacterium]|nr:MAG: response regulator [Verrucomicrobiota bacterium]